jgi:vacuolar-type H+-ATPase subunit D/Vma8
MVFESLIECYSYFEEKNSPQIKNAADKIRSELDEWRRTHMKHHNLMNFIHQELTQTLQQFLQDSTKFQEAVDRVHALMHAQTRLFATKTHQET